VILLALALALSSAPALAGPAVGEPAPAFSLAGTDGKTYTLEGVLADHEGLVLAWFPKAFTPG
jgi:peroxiredoxin Q/BCP